MSLVDCWTDYCAGCDECDMLGQPYHYEASHVLPEPGMARALSGVDCAYLSKFVRYYRDHPDGNDAPDGVEPWLRFSVGAEDVILDRPQVQAIVTRLQEWLAQLDKRDEPWS